jgi:peptidoglycan/LPS O-acetylase OafA/YrhL
VINVAMGIVHIYFNTITLISDHGVTTDPMVNLRFTRSEKTGMTGALTVVLSAVLPWVTTGLGRASATGLAHGHLGYVTIALGFAATAAILAWGWRVRTRALLVGVGLLVAAVVVQTLLTISGNTNPGLGLVTTALGAATLVVDGAYGLVGERVRRRRVTA